MRRSGSTAHAAWCGLVLLVAAGCGGGVGSSPTPPPPPPTASPAPPAGPAAPSAGLLASVGAGFGGVTAARAAGATIVGIGGHRQAGNGLADAPVGGVTVTVSGRAGASRARRAPSGLSGEMRHPFAEPPLEEERALLREILRAPRPGGRSEIIPASARRPQAAVGDVQQFWALAAPIGTSAGTYSQHPAQLVKVTAHWEIWVETSLSGLLSDATAVNAIANDFENAWASDTAHFASNDYTSSPYWNVAADYCDATGKKIGQGPQFDPPQARTIAFIVAPGTVGQGAGGYFRDLNMIPDAAVQCFPNAQAKGAHSNGVPMVYDVWNTKYGTAYEEQEDMVRGSAHEFQHLINFVQHIIVANGMDDEDQFINEGLSMLAQDLAVPALFPASGLTHDVEDALYYANVFLDAPGNFSLAGFSGIDPNSTSAAYNCNGCYGEAFVFQRYLYDHYGGDAYLHAAEMGANIGMPHLAAITGNSTTALLTDFGIALAAGGHSADLRYAWSFPFGQTLQSQLGNRYLISTVTPVNATPGGGSFRGPYDGGYVFVQVPAGGATVTITETTGLPGFAAGIAQH